MISKSDNTKKVAIYGSTGSIGKQALHIMEELGNAKVSTLVCNSNIELLARQIESLQNFCEPAPKQAPVWYLAVTNQCRLAAVMKPI
jgi:1-deoxy-D-xylulose 5-phosphate reductoisomerase